MSGVAGSSNAGSRRAFRTRLVGILAAMLLVGPLSLVEPGVVRASETTAVRSIATCLVVSAKGAASVAEFSGIASASAVDATGSATGGSTTAVSSGTATTTNATDLVVASVGWRTGAAPTTSPGAPWTNLTAQVNSSISEATAWQITSATGAYAAAWTLGASTPGYDGTIAAFKAAAGADTTPPSVPTGLAVSAATSKQLDISWTASTDNVGVQGYRVYRDSVQIATVGTAAFADVGLAGASAHTYTIAAIDGAGNASAQSSSAAGTTTAPVRTTTYAYDLADRLTGITPQAGSGPAVTLTLDALGRHRTRTEAGITATYAYAGESAAIVAISPTSGAATNSALDATGARLAVSTSTGGFGWTLADLHGDSAGYAAAPGGIVTDATRYDPYGEVVASTSSGLPTPWAYQGRLDLAGAADTDLLDFGFRPYVPDLGTFVSPDDQAGSALNPITFNRYLYAGANPATMIDPDGHCYVWIDDQCNDHKNTAAQQQAVAKSHQADLQGPAVSPHKANASQATNSIRTSVVRPPAERDNSHADMATGRWPDQAVMDNSWKLVDQYRLQQEMLHPDFLGAAAGAAAGLALGVVAVGAAAACTATVVCAAAAIGVVGLGAIGTIAFVDDHVVHHQAVSAFDRNLLVTGLVTGAASGMEVAGAQASKAAASSVRGAAESSQAIRFTETVAGKTNRPYARSPLLVRLIMEARGGMPDPQGVPTAQRWDVPGFLNGSDGTWQLVFDVDTQTVLHLLFASRQ